MSYYVIKSILVFAALLVAGSVFVWRLYELLWLNLRRGQPSGAFGQWGERLKGVLIFVAGQLRLFRLLVPGTTHFFIFWGFVILAPTIVEALTQGLVVAFDPDFVLPILGELGPLALLQDLMAVAVAVAVAYALYVRLVVRPERYEGSHRGQGVLVLVFILIIVLSLLTMNAGRISLGEDPLQT